MSEKFMLEEIDEQEEPVDKNPSEDDLPEESAVCQGCLEFYNLWELSEDGFCEVCEEQLE
jgi:hypothetical protein